MFARVTAKIRSGDGQDTLLAAKFRCSERRPQRSPGPDANGSLEVVLDNPLPPSLPRGRATAVFLSGTCFHRREAIERLEIVVDGTRQAPSASRMPRLDLFRALHPDLDPDAELTVACDPRSAEDPEIRCYRSGFWGVVPIGPSERAGEIDLRVDARLSGGGSASAAIGVVAVVEPEAARFSQPRDPKLDGLIAICMATYDPNMELFRRQVQSLRTQTDENWICLISDDCSGEDRFQGITQTIGRDPRFQISRSPERRGFYRNFERALGMVPSDAELIALSDQDDRWYPDKLSSLRSSIGDAQLAYGGMRLVDTEGDVLARSLLEGRRARRFNFLSLLCSNMIPGSAALFRRQVLELALPFPEGPGWDFHDHWLSVVAMATGGVRYVDRPLHDYVQHDDAVLEGHVAVNPETDVARRERRRALPRRGVRALVSDWRKPYFFGYVPAVIRAHVLLARCTGLLTRRQERTLRLLIAAEHSVFGFVWLAVQPLRRPVGSAAVRTEGLLVRGILWRLAIAIRVRGRERPGNAAYDASQPAVEHFGPRRPRRYRVRP